jgi:hypothetical protein
MEDILEIYALPYDPDISLVCMGEKPCYFAVDEVAPIPMSSGHPLLLD